MTAAEHAIMETVIGNLPRHQIRPNTKPQTSSRSSTQKTATSYSPIKKPFNFIENYKNRKKTYLLERNGYSISQADTPIQKFKASELIKRMYASRGYCTKNATEIPHTPNQISFEASIEQQIVGTLTIGYDTADGLLVDALYKQEIDAIREKNRTIYELSKLAVNPEHSSKELLAALFNLAYINARIVHNATDFVIEVNPRHAGYYKRLLGFRQIGGTRTCPRVNAPAVLLHLGLDYVDRQVACLAGKNNSGQRSIYTYFLTKDEETTVADKIRHRLHIPQRQDNRNRMNSWIPSIPSMLHG